MYKILVVDDEAHIRLLIKKYASYEGHTVYEAENGLVAIDMCRNNLFDIIIMDIMMPELDGFTACREIRKFSNTPIIILSARGEEYDKINGFEVGVDDFVVKPFSPKELMLRIQAIMKRTSASIAQQPNETVTIGGFTADLTARIIYVDGQRVNLSPKEYDLLFYLIRNKNIALSREKLICDVWGYDFYGDDRTLDTHIKMLRKQLGNYAELIVTVRGVGYRFEVR
ncbi:MAG: response regulator transcription factor [Clostridia bacterium]|nr:response regulator transcription factor [Oscillospiraceae bacterium]MBQ6702614.1 response regulator transcription factor [Clostridia bacterium]